MGFLDEVLAAVRVDARSKAYFEGLPSEPWSTPRSLKDAVTRRRGGGALLVEYQRRSPGSLPPELPPRSVEDFVGIADRGQACGISVVATRASFDGAPTLVEAVARRTSLPVLFKDFVVEPRQIDAARRAGASAILLIARLELEHRLGHPLAELAELAHDSGLEVLLEFHSEAELRLASRVRADLYGVNVRNLDSLELEPEVGIAALRRASKLHPLLGMGGVEGPLDAERMRAAGADGVLVGSALARAADPVGFLLGLAPPTGERHR